MDCGAKELDVVVNYGRFLDSGHHDAFWDIAGIVKAAHLRGVLVKAILEVSHYTPDQIHDACRLCVAAGVDFVKTSTGLRTRRGHARSRQDHARSRRWKGPGESQWRNQDLCRRRPLPGLRLHPSWRVHLPGVAAMNRLLNTRAYLAGPMEADPDNGVGWRQRLVAELADLGVCWLDPTDKPTT